MFFISTCNNTFKEIICIFDNIIVKSGIHIHHSKYSQVGKRLATIGDQINARYTPEFDSMIKMLNPTIKNIKEVFVTVADRFV